MTAVVLLNFSLVFSNLKKPALTFALLKIP